MKVTMILPISYGGIVHYTANLANSLAKYIEISVIKPKDQNDCLFDSKVDIYPIFKSTKLKPNLKHFMTFNLLNILKDYMSKYKNINKIINEVNPNIIHFTGGIYPHTILMFKNLMLRVLKKEFAVVTTIHGIVSKQDVIRSIKYKNFEESIYYLIINIINKLCFFSIKNYIMNDINFFITHTFSDKLKLVSYGVNSENIYIVPHGFGKLSIKYKENIYNNQKIKKIDMNNKYVLFFGYIRENKGIDCLIQAGNIIQNIYGSNCNIKIIIAGEGNIEKYFKLIKTKSESIFVIINKYIPNELIPKLFKEVELVVLPYTYHGGHSGVLALALSYGKPVVVTSVGNLPELIKNGREGFVVPPRDPKALAEAIVKILEDDRLRKKMSRNALKKAEELSWDRIAKMHIKVYENVLERLKSR